MVWTYPDKTGARFTARQEEIYRDRSKTLCNCLCSVLELDSTMIWSDRSRPAHGLGQDVSHICINA